MSNFTLRTFSKSPRSKTKGVLPDPPTDKLPTLTTGACSWRERATPRSYSALRARTPTPKMPDKKLIDPAHGMPCYRPQVPTIFPALARFFALPPFAPAKFPRPGGPVPRALPDWKEVPSIPEEARPDRPRAPRCDFETSQRYRGNSPYGFPRRWELRAAQAR